MSDISVVQSNTGHPYQIHLIEHIVYAHRGNRDLEMRILTGENVSAPPTVCSAFSRENMHPLFGGFGPVRSCQKPVCDRHPVLLFVPGSGFMGVMGRREILTFTEIVRQGFVVAEIDYRGAGLDDAEFPDAVVDCKEAVRFLRAHAELYRLDSDRIAIGGSSSGAWAAMMTAATCGIPEYEKGENLQFSSEVSAVLDCYGPMDFNHMIEDRIAVGRQVGSLPEEAYSLFRNRVVERRELLHTASVTDQIGKERFMPPCLIIHGEDDITVPPRQSERIYETLRREGKQSQLILVEKAGHGVNFWSPSLIEQVYCWLEEQLGQKEGCAE